MPYEFRAPLRYKIGFAIAGLMMVFTLPVGIAMFISLVLWLARYNDKKEKKYNETHGIADYEEWEDVSTAEGQWNIEKLRRNMEKWK